MNKTLISLTLMIAAGAAYGQESANTDDSKRLGQKKEAKAGMLFYQPPGTSAADNWCFKKDDLWYVYLCQGNGIGVAVSPDLTSFKHRAIAIPGGWYRGDTFLWKGTYYMLYSHPGPTPRGNIINLAESSDLLTWKNSPKNPVMSFPDSRWYDGETCEDSLRGKSSCRDVSVIDDACTDEWVYCCFTTETGRGDYYRRGCVGLARSKNLTDWEYLPPLFSPGLYTAMEVPQVCRVGNKWFLAWLTAPWYGFRTSEDIGQQTYTSGETLIHYAVADNPLGPYKLPDDPTLFRGLMSPYVIDLVRDQEQVMLIPTMFKQQGDNFYDRQRCGLMPALPVRQAADNPDKLEVCFPERVRGYFSASLPVVDPLRITTPETKPEDVAKNGNRVEFTHTSLRLVELTEPTENDLIVDLDFRVEKGRVGVVTRHDPKSRRGCAILVDPLRKQLQFAEVAPLFGKAVQLRVLERHNITSQIGPSFKMSVINSRDYQQVFVNDVLAATFSFARRDAGGVALIMENATGQCVVGGIHTCIDPSK